MKLFCINKELPDLYGKMCILAFTGSGYNNQQAICLTKKGELKAFDIDQLLVIDENEVTENE